MFIIKNKALFYTHIYEKYVKKLFLINNMLFLNPYL